MNRRATVAVAAFAAAALSVSCHGNLPVCPADVNAATLKVAGAGTLTVNGSATGDWAMEVRDAKGNTRTGSDANPPGQESLSVDLKNGSQTEPTASAVCTFVYR